MQPARSNEVVAKWETSSHYWTKHQSRIEEMFAPLTRAIIEAAQIAPGQSVLDIGGGSGEPSLSIAKLVGETGAVAYTDPSSGMVKAACAEAARRKLYNMEFHECPAERLPFFDNRFHAVVSRLSSMFFTDPNRAFSESLRVARPEGRLAFLVWSSKKKNPFFSVISDVLNGFVRSKPDEDDAPEAFRYAKRGKLADLLREAGATEVTEVSVPFKIEGPMSVDQFWEFRTEMSDTFREKLAQLKPNRVVEAQSATAEAVAPYFKSGNMSFPAEALVVSAVKPRAEDPS